MQRETKKKSKINGVKKFLKMSFVRWMWIGSVKESGE